MLFLDERDALTRIKKEIESSKRATLAVAFWGDGAAERLGIADNAGSVSIICNLIHGGTNPAEIEKLKRLGVTVMQCDNLHGKVYLFEDSVVVGSSNASTNGLCIQDDQFSGINPPGGWREANIFSQNPQIVSDASEWVRNLDVRAITEDDLRKALEAWSRRRQSVARSTEKTLIKQLKKNKKFFEGMSVYLVITTAHAGEDVKRHMRRMQKEYGKTLEFYEDFSDLPTTGYLIDFTYDGKNFDSGGLFERIGKPQDFEIRPGYFVNYCWKIEDIHGMKLGSKKQWKSICELIVLNEDGAACVNISDIEQI